MSEYNEYTKDGKAYRSYIDPETGDEIREYEETGVIYNYTKKQMVKGFFTKENTLEMQAKGAEAKKNKPVEAARRGLLRGVSATSLVKDYEMAWEHVVAAQAELAMAVDMGNASTRAAEFIAKMADLDPARIAKEKLHLSDGRNVLSLSNLSPERLDYILSKLDTHGSD